MLMLDERMESDYDFYSFVHQLYGMKIIEKKFPVNRIV